MANEEHLKILEQGVEAWNQWRKGNREIRPDLSGGDLNGGDLNGADLSGANLRGADLSGARLIRANLGGANLRWADLNGAYLYGADLSGAYMYQADFSGAYMYQADLTGADLSEANLSEAYLIAADLRRGNLSGAYLYQANLSEADLSQANLREANLREADLRRANLSEAVLEQSQLVRTNLEKANLTGCRVFGISAWALELSGAIQSNLVITPPWEPAITVDNLEVAQFIYLLLNNEKIRDVIDTITTKVVLILGRFTPERKAVLDVIRNELRKRNYLPVLFDFEKPASRDLTETVRTLAHLARFIIADITEPRSIPQELQAIVPDLAVPVQPLLLQGSTGEYGMFQDLRKYDWVLEVHRYVSLEDLLASFGDKVITPAEAKAKEWEKRRLLRG